MDDEVRVARKVMSERVELFRVPVIEDDLAIQMVVCRRLASEPLDTKHASLLLYGLQVGSVGVRRNETKRSRTIF